MTSAGAVVLLMILAPAVVAFACMLRDGLHPLLAFGAAIMIAVVWALVLVVLLVLVAGSAVAGPYWVILVTAVLVVEILRLKPQRPKVRGDTYSGFKK